MVVGEMVVVEIEHCLGIWIAFGCPAVLMLSASMLCEH